MRRTALGYNPEQHMAQLNGRPENGDHTPMKFGRRARAWLTRLLTGSFTGIEWFRSHPDVTAEQFVAWYLESPTRYVTWVDAEEYRGKGYANGAWTVAWDVVRADWFQALQELRDAAARARDAEQFLTLDDWLRAEVAGDLVYRGARGGTERIPDELRSRSMRLAEDRRRQWPIACACGKSFVRDRANARRCAECREAARNLRRGVRS